MPRLRPSNSSAYTPSPAPTHHATPAPGSAAASTSANLPAYESSAFPLTPAAKDKISSLLNQHPSQKLNTYYKTASDNLTERVQNINALYAETKDKHQRQNGKRARDEEAGEDEPADIDQLEGKVNGMTERMEMSVRKCIDGQARIEAVDNALKEVQGNAQKTGNTQATQATAAVTQDGVEEDEDVDEQSEALVTTFNENVERRTDAYLGKTPKLRYKEHKWFRNFKSSAYYAAQGENDNNRRMDENTWFEEDGGPRPGETGGAVDDEDFEEMGERVSTKCPLTLQDFKEPVTSTKCPHSFEKAAILDFLKNVRPPTRGRNTQWIPELECPVPGCASKLTKEDLEDDVRLKTLIKRKQRREELARQEAEEEDEGRRREERDGTRVEEIESGSEDDIDNVERSGAPSSSIPASIKRERLRRATQDAIEELEED